MSNSNTEIEFIRNMVRNSMYDVSSHAVERMNERNVSSHNVEEIILNHDARLAKEQGNGTRYEFYSNTNDKVIVALSGNMMIPVVVTVIKGGK